MKSSVGLEAGPVVSALCGKMLRCWLASMKGYMLAGLKPVAAAAAAAARAELWLWWWWWWFMASSAGAVGFALVLCSLAWSCWRRGLLRRPGWCAFVSLVSLLTVVVRSVKSTSMGCASAFVSENMVSS